MFIRIKFLECCFLISVRYEMSISIYDLVHKDTLVPKFLQDQRDWDNIYMVLWGWTSVF